MRNNVSVAGTLMLIMFLVSGSRKVSSLGMNDAGRLGKAIGMQCNAAGKLVLLAGLWELASCISVLYGLWSSGSPKKRKRYVIYGCYSLAAFTALVTLVFYANPVKIYPLMSNLTSFSALLLLPEVCALFSQ